MDENIKITKHDSLAQLKKQFELLLATTPENKKPFMESQFTAYARLFQRYLEESGSSIEWNQIENLPDGLIKQFESLKKPKPNVIHDMLKKLVVIKLNGGLGTSMDCYGPKSTIKVKDDLTFLDLTVQQIQHLNKKYHANVPLVFMNSFNSDKDTEQIIRKYKKQVKIYTFNQSCFPRVSKDTFLPIAKSCKIEDCPKAWYPPGHGDFFECFKNSGLLQTLMNDGRVYCFISNIDNLGATVDLNILNFLLSSKKNSLEFLMEVSKKISTDIKSDTLIYYKKKLQLLEMAKVPENHIEEFKCIRKFKFFNTNNLWIKLNAIDRVLSKESMDLEITVCSKTLKNNINIIQFETAIGASMKYFNYTLAINVPRKRFLPVKTTSDLLLVMSNLYCVRNGSLIMNPLREFPKSPVVKLGHDFSNVREFLSRFRSIPDILELDHLTVSGNVTFSDNISFKGTVIIIAKDGKNIDLPSNTVLENKSVTGILRIQDY